MCADLTLEASPGGGALGGWQARDDLVTVDSLKGRAILSSPTQKILVGSLESRVHALAPHYVLGLWCPCQPWTRVRAGLQDAVTGSC